MSTASWNPSASRDRAEAQRWARDLLARADWAVLDTETTGLDNSAEVIQVAAVAPDGALLIDTLVRPNRRIPPDAIAIHGITDAMVADAPSDQEIYPRLREMLTDKIVICYNAAFDRRMLQQTARRHETPSLPVVWQCAMERYASYVGRWSSRHGHYAWLPLPRRPEYLGVKHQAIVDCLATLDVIRKIAAE